MSKTTIIFILLVLLILFSKYRHFERLITTGKRNSLWPLVLMIIALFILYLIKPQYFITSKR